MDFKDKNVIITGGTRGIGAAICSLFLESGANVIVTGTQSKLSNSSHLEKLKYHKLDFLSDKSIDNFVDFINHIKKIDVLINNAGINKINHLTEISKTTWDKLNSVNLRGPFLLTKFVARKMQKNTSGKIVNISSIFGVVSKKERATYSSTKWGLIGFTKSVALDLAPFNILVNAVSPGFVDTDLTRQVLGVENMEKLRDQIPQGRLANPSEIAKVVQFLCSDLNTYITGQNIIVDGGFTSV